MKLENCDAEINSTDFLRVVQNIRVTVYSCILFPIFPIIFPLDVLHYLYSRCQIFSSFEMYNFFFHYCVCASSIYRTA